MEELTKLDLKQLQAINKVSAYKKILKENPNFSKNDALWYIYNDMQIKYITKKDYDMAYIMYKRMYEILYKENKYEQALYFIICYLYLRLYTIMPSDFMLFDVDYSQKHVDYFNKELKKINKKYAFNLNEELIDFSLKKYLYTLYDFEKVSCFKNRILK